MAGYVLKISIEGIRPPVWRRIVIPEKITFADLHNMIQIVFGWENEHLHDFSVPSREIRVGVMTDSWVSCEYDEEEVLVEQLLLNNKWIRYTYDFGDDWQHSIVCEKKDEAYDKRFATLLKAKGDNFEEDSGGVWGDGSRVPFDPAETSKRLEQLYCPMDKKLKSREIEPITMEQAARAMAEFVEEMFRESEASVLSHNPERTVSSIDKKLETWSAFVEAWETCAAFHEKTTQLTFDFIEEEDITATGGLKLEIVQGTKTNEQLLEKHGVQELRGICKALQLSLPKKATRKMMVEAISDAFCKHPEYFLYPLNEEDYNQLKQWMERPYGDVEWDTELPEALGHSIYLGLADLKVTHKKSGDHAVLSFAQDSKKLLSAINKKDSKKFYSNLSAFIKKLMEFIMVYGVIDLDSMYTLFCRAYRINMEQADFNRYVYWHACLRGLLINGKCADGTDYVSCEQLDINQVLDGITQYAEDMDYKEYSITEIKKKTDEINARSEWFVFLFEILVFQMGLEEETVAQAVEETFCDIMNGESLPFVLENLLAGQDVSERLDILCELWGCVSSLMLDLEIPVLKGRSRNEYAEEKGISPWLIQMEDGISETGDSKEAHMYKFPVSIQEDMQLANSYVSHEAMQKLLSYKKRYRIKSEEFLYLLAESHIVAGEFETASELVRELEKSSKRGAQAAKGLWDRLESGVDVLDEFDDEMPMFSWGEEWEELRKPQTPYVREEPKIGRNDPCPCGSGKKYKKCCGR